MPVRENWTMLRALPSERALLERAAALVGVAPSVYVREQAVRGARRDLRRAGRVVTVSRAVAEAALGVLERAS